jgi:hypothetical protein
MMLILLFALAACAPSPDFALYQGKSLKIAVIGEVPKVKEEQVRFVEMTFKEMNSEELNAYDAVFIRENNLLVASESQYTDIYLHSSIPFFFIGASNPIPFTVKEVEYDETWEWTAGTGYTVGVLASQEEDTKRHWSYGLYNDEKTEKHLKQMYSTILNTINELNP